MLGFSETSNHSLDIRSAGNRQMEAQENWIATFQSQTKAQGHPRQKLNEFFMNLFTTSLMGLNDIQLGSLLIKERNALHNNGILFSCLWYRTNSPK